ncbi:MAG TPA: asparagine synthase-related protein [Sedimentisphaerales bacterium]|nr:asparagine synthase-related protein [Sedimentisphaerales bacterium]
MNELESSFHLYQPPLYHAPGGLWKKSFLDAAKDCTARLTWDPAAVLAILGFGYTCGDRTLIHEVKRQPWLSKIGLDNEPRFEEIPSHGRLHVSPPRVAENLENLLCSEALEACGGRKEIYLLLSGGLDSRIVAGILAKLYKEGKLTSKPVAVTWGSENSRDVVYGRMVAETLGFEWVHVTIAREDITHNINETAITIGCLVSPMDLHVMHWFKSVSKEALVLAASYGDSVGRAEFSGRHVLELNCLRPVNAFGLVRDAVLASAYDGVMNDLEALRKRSPGQPPYVICEHEMQGHYMRNMIAHAMSVIGQYCVVYQMFTDPRVYSYMWSIHPALRSDSAYAALLEKLEPRLVHMPWARTNRAVRGKTEGARPGLSRHFDDYTAWITGPLFDELCRYIDAEWFAETGIFDYHKVKNLANLIRVCKGRELSGGFAICGKWAWLAAFRRMAERLKSLGKSVELDKMSVGSAKVVFCPTAGIRRLLLKRILSRPVFIYDMVAQCRKACRIIRRNLLKYQALRKYRRDDIKQGFRKPFY